MITLNAVSILPAPPVRSRLAESTHCRTFLSGPVSGNPLQSLLGKLSVLSGTILSAATAFGSAALAAEALRAAKPIAAPIVAAANLTLVLHTALIAWTITSAGGVRNKRKFDP